MSSKEKANTFLSLNDDVLGIILQATPIPDAVLPLSMTCKRMRSYCMPLLFHNCVIRTTYQMTEMPVPSSLWPYIRSITLKDSCREWYVGMCTSDHYSEFPDDSKEYIPDTLLCIVYDPDILGTALRAMPSLRSVSFELHGWWKHGLPWPVVEAVLTIPHLREFSCNGHAFAPRAALPQAPQLLDSLASLTSFRYSRHDFRDIPRTYESEAAALKLVLQHLHPSLETLELSTESAPLSDIIDLPWPCLRELRLRGELDLATSFSLPTISTLAHMSALRTLDLRISSPGGTSQTIWPAGYQAEWPWPHLQHLTVSFPSVDDEIFRHLPDTLRSLNLQYYPHLSTDLWQIATKAVRIWRFPSSTSSDILRILRACPTLYLDQLELEYHEDDSEESLLQYIAATFPLLTFLKIRRYRAPGAPAVDLERFARPLCALVHLRTLCLHLDLPSAPFPTWSLATARLAAFPLYYFKRNDIREFRTTLHKTAGTLAPLLGPSVETLRLARPCPYAAEYSWAVYRIVRENVSEAGLTAEGEVRAEYAPELSHDPLDKVPSPRADGARPSDRNPLRPESRSTIRPPTPVYSLDSVWSPEPYYPARPGLVRRVVARIGQLCRGGLCG